MISLQEQIAKFLDLKGVGIFEPFDITGDIFIDYIPPQPVEAIGVYMTIVNEPNFAHEEQAVTIQCLVRSEDKHTALNKGSRIIKLLNGFNDGQFVVNGHHIIDTQATSGLPVYLGTDDNGNFEYSISLNIDYVKEDITYGY